MITPEQIKLYIQAGLTCLHIEVTGDGHHFEAIIVSEAFVGLTRIQQHQLVYSVLGSRMHSEIHALSIKALTPAQW